MFYVDIKDIQEQFEKLIDTVSLSTLSAPLLRLISNQSVGLVQDFKMK